ncbi:hypothetical protein L1765_03920 [Microaerobacter geothermalis]|uniref:hypothetical protein n=1 Tax=Microaerobacter geothermalis TaxID=674972 RepID=UPI001F236D4F|nr:hypothetical protein [Microaerobacter geothermalis]MCF6093142.1 hypothetical protein [Microaerobacter geothermalis]
MAKRVVSIKDLQQKINQLEETLDNLRVGRRVLMNLLEITQEESNQMIAELQRENLRLKKQNHKYAKELFFLKVKGFK